MRRYLCIALLALSGCGGGGGGGDSLVVATVDGQAVIESAVHFSGLYSVTLVGGGDEVSVLWSEPSGSSHGDIVRQDIGADLVLSGLRSRVEADANHWLSKPSACHDGDDLAVAWNDFLFETPIGITLDEGNVAVTPSWPPAQSPSRPHPNTIGRQNYPSIACLSDGDRVIAWHNFCGAVETVGNGRFYFVPDECDAEPPHGNYLRFFDSSGAAISEPILLDEQIYPWPLVAATEASGFVVIAGASIQTWAKDRIVGRLDGADVWSPDASLACVGRRCAAATGGQVLLFDASRLDESVVVTFQESSEPGPDETIDPRNANLACDNTGICVVTWVLERATTDYDVIDIESLGIYARAFELNTGRMGPAIQIQAPTIDDYGARIAATGPGGFLIARAPGADIVLSRLQVD